MCGKNFSIYGAHILRKSLNLWFFTHASGPHSKRLVEFFENLFPPRQKGLEEAEKKKFYLASYIVIEQRGWVKAKTLLANC